MRLQAAPQRPEPPVRHSCEMEGEIAIVMRTQKRLSPLPRNALTSSDKKTYPETARQSRPPFSPLNGELLFSSKTGHISS